MVWREQVNGFQFDEETFFHHDVKFDTVWQRMPIVDQVAADASLPTQSSSGQFQQNALTVVFLSQARTERTMDANGTVEDNARESVRFPVDVCVPHLIRRFIHTSWRRLAQVNLIPASLHAPRPPQAPRRRMRSQQEP